MIYVPVHEWERGGGAHILGPALCSRSPGTGAIARLGGANCGFPHRNKSVDDTYQQQACGVILTEN